MADGSQWLEIPVSYLRCGGAEMSWLGAFFEGLFGGTHDAESTPASFPIQEDEAIRQLYGPGRPSRKPPPADAGEYRWVHKETGEIGYIGQTNNLSRRKREHEQVRPEFAEDYLFVWKRAHEDAIQADLREHERKKIKKKKPPLNRRAGGGGRNTRNC